MNELTLLDWKRRIFELYADVRREPDPARAWRHWRDVRDELFRSHPQTPIPATTSFEHLPYFALPRYIEFRDSLPRSPVGRVLKRELRAEGVTPTTWDADAPDHA